MPDQNQDTNVTHNETSPTKSLFDSSISTSIIIGSLIIAGSVITGAYMLSQGGFGTAGNQVGAGIPLVKVADRADEPSIGSKTAPVVMYEFGDFQCPFCKKFFQESYAELKTKYIDTGKVRLVFRHFPLTAIHVNAQISSEAAECANRQGRFEDYYTILYTSGQGDGTGLDVASLKKYATQIGLNTTAFNQCLDNHETKPMVAGDLALGSSLEVSGTPTFFINGQAVIGAQPLATFKQIIDSSIKK